MLTLWYEEYNSSSKYQHTPWIGALIKVSTVNKNINTRFVNGMFSVDFPSVNTAMKYLQNAGKGGVIGGNPQNTRPSMNKGRQNTDMINQKNMVKHQSKMNFSVEDSLGC